ncbi:unnamed protein product [Camellia sinensis]
MNFFAGFSVDSSERETEREREMGSKAEEENKEEEASSTPKLPLVLTIPLPLQSPEHSGMLTPPLHTSATVPFRWEEEPGKPLPSTTTTTTTTTTAITPPPSPPNKYFLELPPRLQIMESSKMTKMPSPNTVLDGPYHLGMMPPVFRSSSFRVRRRERQGSFGSSCESPSERGQLGALVFLSKEERGGGLFGSWRRKQQHYPRKEVIGGEGSFVFSSPSSMDLADFVGGGKVKKMSRIRRNGSSFSSLSQVKSHFWASIYDGLKQVLPWKSRKSKKDGFII